MKQRPKKLAPPIKTVAVKAEVSQNCDKLGWKFKVYVSPTDSKALQKLIDAQDDAVTQQFKVRVRYLSNTGMRDWKEPAAKNFRE